MAAMARPFRAIFCEGSCVVNPILNGGMQETMVFASFLHPNIQQGFPKSVLGNSKRTILEVSTCLHNQFLVKLGMVSSSWFVEPLLTMTDNQPVARDNH